MTYLPQLETDCTAIGVEVDLLVIDVVGVGDHGVHPLSLVGGVGDLLWLPLSLEFGVGDLGGFPFSVQLLIPVLGLGGFGVGDLGGNIVVTFGFLVFGISDLLGVDPVLHDMVSNVSERQETGESKQKVTKHTAGFLAEGSLISLDSKMSQSSLREPLATSFWSIWIS